MTLRPLLLWLLIHRSLIEQLPFTLNIPDIPQLISFSFHKRKYHILEMCIVFVWFKIGTYDEVLYGSYIMTLLWNTTYWSYLLRFIFKYTWNRKIAIPRVKACSRKKNILNFCVNRGDKLLCFYTKVAFENIEFCVFFSELFRLREHGLRLSLPIF